MKRKKGENRVKGGKRKRGKYRQNLGRRADETLDRAIMSVPSFYP